MHINELWESDELSARLARIGLLPLAGLYAVGWEAYLATYRMGFKKAKAPHHPVLCVGNLVTGGAGKTPTTLFFARLLQEMGFEVVVGCSGYGGPHAEAAAIAPSGSLMAAEWGDEPAMMRWLYPDLPLVVGRRRVLAAELVHGSFPSAVLVMDDGFQHLPLAKDITVLLDDPSPKNRLCLPAGPYREPRFNRKRADLVIPDRFRQVALPQTFVDPEGSVVDLTGEYDVLCALGQPARFLNALKDRLKRPPTYALTLNDHDPMNGGTLLSPFQPSSFELGRPIVVTAKDWVKVRDRADVANYRFVIAKHEIKLEPEAEMRQWLASKLHERTA